SLSVQPQHRAPLSLNIACRNLPPLDLRPPLSFAPFSQTSSNLGSLKMCVDCLKIRMAALFGHVTWRVRENERDTARLRRLLSMCTHRERPCHCTTNKRNELPPPHARHGASSPSKRMLPRARSL